MFDYRQASLRLTRIGIACKACIGHVWISDGQRVACHWSHPLLTGVSLSPAVKIYLVFINCDTSCDYAEDSACRACQVLSLMEETSGSVSSVGRQDCGCRRARKCAAKAETSSLTSPSLSAWFLSILQGEGDCCRRTTKEGDTLHLRRVHGAQVRN